MPKILITNCHLAHNQGCEHNKGTAAVMISTIKVLRQCIPDAEIATVVQLPEDFAQEYGIRVIQNKLFSYKAFSLCTIMKSWSNLVRCASWALSHNRLPAVAKTLTGNRELKEYASADVILDVSMDLYSDDFGFISVIEHSKDVLMAVLLRKPVVIWAQSLGPFRSRLTSWLVRLALNRATLITVREEISLGHLRELGVNVPPIYVTADPAFLLEPAPEERAEEILLAEGIDRSGASLIGLAMTWATLMAEARASAYLRFMQSMYRIICLLITEGLFTSLVRQASRLKGLDMTRFAKVEAMAQLVDHLVMKLDATVILIPHDTDPWLDDRIIAREVLHRTRQQKRVQLISGDYSAPELKAVIGQCDLFIGAKMHANIAATTMGVPTVALAYSHKFLGIMQLLGQEEYVCRRFTLEEAKSKVERAWSEREKISSQLLARVNIVREHALHNAKLVADVLHRARIGTVS